MRLRLGTPGISRFIFVALLLLFNWPLLSIPAPEALPGFLFGGWALAIVLLFLAARGNGDEDDAGGGNARPGDQEGGGV